MCIFEGEPGRRSAANCRRVTRRGASLPSRQVPGAGRLDQLRRKSPREGRQFFLFGQSEVMLRNFPMVVANLLNQGAVSKPQILRCAGAVLVGSAGGLPKFLTFFAI